MKSSALLLTMCAYLTRATDLMTLQVDQKRQLATFGGYPPNVKQNNTQKTRHRSRRLPLTKLKHAFRASTAKPERDRAR